VIGHPTAGRRYCEPGYPHGLAARTGASSDYVGNLGTDRTYGQREWDLGHTARRYGVRNFTVPMANVRGGSRYLHDLLRLFKQNLRLVLTAYNAGENAVIRHGYKIPPYQETQLYVEKVLQYYRQYQAVLYSKL